MYVGIAWTLRVGLATYSSTLDTISRMTCLGKRYLLIRSMSCILSKALFLSRNTLSLLKRLRSRLCIMSKVAIIVNRLYLRPNKSRRRTYDQNLVRRKLTPLYETHFSPISERSPRITPRLSLRLDVGLFMKRAPGA